MMKRRSLKVCLSAMIAAAALVVAGCSNDGSDAGSSDSPDADAPVTISISGLPSTENAAAREVLLTQVAAFEDKHPNITIDAQEVIWSADTFQAMLAGGTMPTVMSVPFTAINALMARDQVADLTDYVGDSEVLSALNPILADKATDSQGRVRGIPHQGYTMALIYNRALFRQAGLDPDQPPTTWDEVRQAAQTIDQNTDAQGFAAYTMNNYGGWMLTTTSYAFGSLLESEDGATATVDNPATRAVLEFYRDLRWEDNTFGSNFLLEYNDVSNMMAAGKLGMYVGGGDSYWGLVQNRGMSWEDYGQAGLPQAAGGLGALGGGNFAVISPTATPDQIAAGLKWIEFCYFSRYLDQDAAVQRAKDDVAAGSYVGAPGLSPVNDTLYDRWLGWVADEINVPRDQYADYLATVNTLPVVAEPAQAAQEIYAALDPVIQAVLTDQQADIPRLLAEAQVAAQTAVDAANR
jgi:ABC-type glycerol-3-phosphate transport system substrate-binding protein